MTNPTPHGQVPEALRLAHIFDNPLPPEWPDMVAAAAELRRQHARIAELEAVGAGGVQAPPARPTVEQVEDELSMGHGAWDMVDPQELIGAVLRLAASPTPPAEQAAPNVSPSDIAKLRHLYANLKNGGVRDTAQAKRIADGLLAPIIERLEQAAPKAAPGVGNSGFDHKTAADLLNNKTVSDEAVRKFVAASRWAHDERAALSATLLAMHGVLTSREAEIALLKRALMEAEAAPAPNLAKALNQKTLQNDSLHTRSEHDNT